MDDVESKLTLEKELENLRENLNRGIAKNIVFISKEQYRDILEMSKKLDDVIVDYMKIVNNNLNNESSK